MTRRRLPRWVGTTPVVLAATAVLMTGALWITARAQVAPRPDANALAKASLAQHTGTIMVRGLSQPVEVVRDTWGIPHIYAQNTPDLFFAQGFVVAQDRMWQLEMWRRNGEGRLAEVLGPDYVTRDKFARLLAFRGDWDEEFRRYHPEGKTIFTSFAAGINASIQKAIDEKKVPVEFEILGFQPQPVWTAKTVLTRMPGWTLSRNASSEVTRAIAIKALGMAKVEELNPTTPRKKLEVPAGLDLADIDAAILDITRGANDIRWSLKADLGSNNWVVSGAKSATGGPLLANDPHREVVNPALRYVVHLVAPGWNALGATEPGLPGISIGHNEKLAWGFTILGMDQQDLYVEETDPANPNRYQYKGEWLDMKVERELIAVKGKPAPVEYDVKLTRHGPVLYENAARRRAFALKWVGAEPGGAGYLGSLNVMQTADWKQFNDALPKAWFIPSHSLVYADAAGNIGYRGVALTPVRKGWDGLLPVPGKDGRYEWDGFVPYDKLPSSFNTPKGFYNSSNNDVVPKILPGYPIPLGYEYGAPYRYDRVAEVLGAPRKFGVGDLEKLQQDVVSIPAREMVPLLRKVKTTDADLRQAIDRLLSWNFALDRDSDAATIYEFWMLKLAPLAYAPRIPEAARASFRQHDIGQVIAWMKAPDAAYGDNGRARAAARDKILLDALGLGLAEIRKRFGADPAKWKWGDVHTADFLHPLATTPDTKRLFQVDPVRRGGDSYTVMNTSSASESGSKQLSGASFMFVFDVKDWDRSTGLSVPGNSAQPGSPHYKDMVPYWGEGKYFPLAYSRKSVDEHAKSRLMLEPLRDPSTDNPATAPRFGLVQPDLFAAAGGQCSAWGDFDNDGDLDLFVGFRRGELNKLYRNDAGTFAEIAASAGLADAEDTRACGWGDFDQDGNLDLYVGFARTSSMPNKLYRNEGNGRHFTDVARAQGVDAVGESRQLSFVDFDSDGQMDLFVAFRDRPNMLFRNEKGRFTDVAKALGVADPRKTVGAVWFDMDEDGDLDLFVANQDGDTNGFYRNDRTQFVDIAHELGMDGDGRPAVYGSVGPSLADFDNDGRLDLFVAGYGPSVLWHNEGGGRFVNVAVKVGVAGDHHLVASSWGDYDNDGRLDLYAGGYLTGIANYRDYMYHNDGATFSEVASGALLKHDASHGVQWADFDQDGALDLSFADNGTRGGHFVFRNQLPPDRAKQSLEILVLDDRGHFTMAGSEVRVYAAGTRTLLGTRIVDTGSGYCSQNAMPVHVGLPAAGRVDVEVTTLTPAGRKVLRTPGVDPSAYARKLLVLPAGR
jgi:penicillin amidase